MATVTEIDVDRERSVSLTFDDGYVCSFALEDLRRACPCATCRSQRDRGEASWPRAASAAPLRIDDAELVGAWGLSLRWNDGHSTGIYPWESLRRWSEAGGDGGIVADLGGNEG